MKRIEPKVYPVTITVKTGLHIGGGESRIEIGGVDSPVVVDQDGFPYIPGSSLKGKFRSLFEVESGDYHRDGGPHKFQGKECLESCIICRAFGVAGAMSAEDFFWSNPENKGKSLKNADEKTKEEWKRCEARAKEAKELLPSVGPTRLLVRDIFLSEDSWKRFRTARNRGETLLEHKMEVVMNRATGTAAGAGPRTLERVPVGTVFEGEIVFRLFDCDGDGGARDLAIAEKFFGSEHLLKSLLEADCLGGHGSRGSGQVTIDFEKKKDDTVLENV